MSWANQIAPQKDGLFGFGPIQASLRWPQGDLQIVTNSIACNSLAVGVRTEFGSVCCPSVATTLSSYVRRERVACGSYMHKERIGSHSLPSLRAKIRSHSEHHSQRLEQGKTQLQQGKRLQR